jgi:DNA modification methylase
MQIEKRKVSELKYYPGNPRKISKKTLEKLKESIREFGFVEPLVINKENEVIGGNQRLKALKELGIKEVEVVVVDLPKSKEKALNIALNKIGGEFDFELLKTFIDDIEPVDLEITGLDLDEIESKFEVWTEQTPNDDEYEEPEEIQVYVKRGDIYKLGEHRLMCGDATSRDDIQKLTAGEKLDMVFTDPPYEMEDLSWFKYAREVVDDKALFVMHSDKNQVRLAYENFDIFRQFFVLVFSTPIFLTTTASYSHILISWYADINKKHKNYRFLRDGFKTVLDGYKKVLQLSNEKFRHAKSLYVPQAFIRHFSLKGDKVLDLFGGLGSTLIACETLKRKCYMMEIEPLYCQYIIDRYEKFTGKRAEKINE